MHGRDARARDDDDDDDGDVVGAWREDGARLVVLRRQARLCAVRGRHRPVLGAIVCARVPEPGAGTVATWGHRVVGPDAAGVGWIDRYSLVDRGGSMGAGQLRALPDWLPEFELKMPPNVAQPRWVAC